jgi:hypothetical protein
LETSILNERIKRQESIASSRVKALNPLRCLYGDLARAIGDIEARRASGSTAEGATPPAELTNPIVCLDE